MDEDIAAIDANTRNQKIKDFFVKFKKHIIFFICTIFLLIFAYFIYVDIQKKNRVKISEKYNQATTEFYSGNKIEIEKELVEIIKLKDKTYSPLSLYFLLENGIITENDKINKFFDILIEETDLEKEIKNLIIYKKALFNSEFESENNLIKILNPIINSDSIWKSHALYLMAEFFYFKNEKQKSKEFFEKIISDEKSNLSIKKEVQKRLNRDFSE
jgi:predicted negative regulator of RcsB-dependent stress response|tara:strand:+ start:429 stop:1073 length:645 start_codon:yes stop_codon:yes gene_type:complete